MKFVGGPAINLADPGGLQKPKPLETAYDILAKPPKLNPKARTLQIPGPNRYKGFGPKPTTLNESSAVRG